MNQVSPETNVSSREDTLLENTGMNPTVEPDLTNPTIFPSSDQAEYIALPDPEFVAPYLSEEAELGVLLGRQAANLAVAIGVSTNQEVQVREVNRFLNATGYDTNASPAELAAQQSFVRDIISQIEGHVRTETAAALIAQNKALRTQLADIKAALMEQPADILIEMAPLLEQPKHIEPNVDEFVSEIQETLQTSETPHNVPTTDELETAFLSETSEAMSPARGISIREISRKALSATVRFFTPPIEHAMTTGNSLIDVELESIGQK
ncbi:MAG: hypothetical protein EOT05_03100 [Candidatus Microsaccharimonas sossegonensis]|uniref:Uncharacterized protein n=1 Tax=Candidatus Microsaccharimonas sossegonensis TaxID=2506948 RepID=A0A4Q0AI47_9BACT|nr:MAG: hypothetical protein EOT05_03100 [Candidatus Microsaccharimonas sossegonensis]